MDVLRVMPPAARRRGGYRRDRRAAPPAAGAEPVVTVGSTLLPSDREAPRGATDPRLALLEALPSFACTLGSRRLLRLP